MTEDQIWSIAAKLAAIAEPNDPHARFELAQAIASLALSSQEYRSEP